MFVVTFLLLWWVTTLPFGSWLSHEARKPAPLPKSHPASTALIAGLQAAQQSRFEEATALLSRSEQLTPHTNASELTRTRVALMGAQIAVHQYREALATYQRADTVAAHAGDVDSRSALAMNLSTVYSRQADHAGARQALDAAVRFARPGSYYFPLLLMQQAQLAGVQGDHANARRLMYDAIARADSNKENSFLAVAWEILGHLYNLDHRPGAAQASFGQAVRWAGISRTPASASLLRGLAQAREELGDLGAAEEYLDRALEAQRTRGSSLPLWLLFQSRAQVRAARHHNREALDDAVQAIQNVRRWRAAVLPSPSVQIQAEGRLQAVYSLAVNTGAELYLGSGDRRLLAVTLQAAEENRAVALRDRYMRGTKWENALPPAYWECLDRYRKALSRSPVSNAEITAWQQQLTQYELQAGLDLPQAHPSLDEPEAALRDLQGRLPRNAVALSFQLGPVTSHLWAVTNDDVALYTLPDRDTLVKLVRAFRQAVESDSPEVRRVGSDLYQTLFGSLDANVAKRTQWLLSVEDGLFELPFAALTTPGSRFLIEEHSVQFLPTLNAYQPMARQDSSGLFAAIADPIFSLSDPRFQKTVKYQPEPSSTALLPRLPNTAREAEACSRIWNQSGRSLLLTGTAATLEGVRAAVRQRPAVLHFSTHFIVPQDRPDQGSLALSLLPAGDADSLTVADAASFQVPGSLIVMNGCASGTGKALPGAGWLGMTRSWLLAGAQNVAAAYWPVVDDQGLLWQQFYREYQTNPAPPAVLLQAAQVQMIHSRTWRAQPRHWAAYFLTGRG